AQIPPVLWTGRVERDNRRADLPARKDWSHLGREIPRLQPRTPTPSKTHKGQADLRTDQIQGNPSTRVRPGDQAPPSIQRRDSPLPRRRLRETCRTIQQDRLRSPR